MTDKPYFFDMARPENPSIIKVIGVGGGGSNAVNFMYAQGIKDVDFVIVNTDKQALFTSPVKNKIQIGKALSNGLGAGANPEKGKAAAEEDIEEIKQMLGEGTNMVFITAGMGGGTGTGAAPVVARVAKEMGILTVGIVTKPFGFEGRKKMQSAEAGIAELKQNCDTVIEILNEKVQAVCGNMSVKQAFQQADSVLMTAAKSIAEIITGNGIVNVDFEDVKTVMHCAGSAVMGSGVYKGENRGIRAAEAALNSPFLNNLKVQGAQKILLSIASGEEPELGMAELTEITEFIRDQTGEEADMIWGQSLDPSLGENLRVTVIATGFQHLKQVVKQPVEGGIVVVDLDQKPSEVDDPMNLLGIRTVEPKPEPIRVPEVVKEEIKLPPIAPPVPKAEPVTMVDIDGNQLIPDSSGNAEVPLAKIPVFQSSMSDYRNTLKNLSESQRVSKELPVIQQFEDQPAYIRKGGNPGTAPSSLDNNISRFQVRKDSGLSDKNSYLHDNVD